MVARNEDIAWSAGGHIIPRATMPDASHQTTLFHNWTKISRPRNVIPCFEIKTKMVLWLLYRWTDTNNKTYENSAAFESMLMTQK